MAGDAPTSLAPGFRFHPTDEELVRFYLKRKVTGKSFRFDPIAVVDVYKNEPWDLPYKSKLKTRDLEWYFFSALDRKYGSGSRTNRATEKGYWKTTGKDRPVKHGDRTVGMKKTLVYHSGRAPHGARTNWVMHEYRLVDDHLAQPATLQDAFVLCRIFEKSGAGPKNGEKYGAPLIEEEWEEHDDVAPDMAVGIASDGADRPSNFCYGECSSYPEYSQVFVEDQKPLEGTVGIPDPQNAQLSNIENALGFNSTLHDLDVYLDANGYLLTADDGSFLETKDLVNPYEGAAMLDEYLSFSDDDISKYISFDSPLTTESEIPIPDQGPLFIHQNVEGGETNDISSASKHDFEAPSSDEASSKQNPQLPSGNTHPFVKQANKLLAGIPAPPAFASEFPPKDTALRLHTAAQSSNSAHVTTGMISITDITLRGNAMDWMVGKNGGLNAIVSTGFSQPDYNSVSGLLCSKTAFVLSHGSVFLVCFSVLILSLSFKIGSFMYTGK